MKSTLNLYDTTGKLTSKVKVPSAFDIKIDPSLIALAVRVHLDNQRQSTSKTKTRGEVNKTTHKVWKQKGTGRARHGSKAAPIFVGGGVAHGPTGVENYSLKMPKKMRQKAIISAISQAIEDDKIILVDGLKSLQPNVKSASSLLKKLELDQTKLLVLLDSPLDNVLRGTSNLSQVTVSQAIRTNVVEILNAQKILLHLPALDLITSTFAKSLKKSAPVKPTAKVAKA